MAANINRKQIILRIVDLFNKNVRGKNSDTSASNQRHDGRDGHWLETQMGIAHNGNNAPDIYGFEMKNHTKSKTTFGDWSADYYIFNDKNFNIDKTQFLKSFGMPNIEKNNRYSWSGRSCPKIDDFNIFGQKLVVNESNDVMAIYSYSKDSRCGKSIQVPDYLKLDNLILAKWSMDNLKNKVEKKFNNNGWFKCNMDDAGVYSEIVFGNPISFRNWIDGVRKGLIFFDSGMYDGNSRNYSSWRANNKYWDSLIIDRY